MILQLNILHFSVRESSFVKKDITYLKESHAVKILTFNTKNKFFTPFAFIFQKIQLLVHIWFADVLVCQFSGYHSFLPALFGKIFKKPVLIISGGTDCNSFPSIRYGNLYRPILKIFTHWSFKLASHIAPKHNSLMICDYTYQDKDFTKQGLLYFHPDIQTPYTVIPNGYNADKFKLLNSERIKNRFVTVALGFDMPFTVELKGIDLILSIAPDFPQCEFVIIGVPQSFVFENKPDNVICFPPVKNEELISHYNRATYYLQLSMAEGFPNALCEAMLCGCVPIVSDVASMPEIVSDSGFVLKKKSKSLLSELIKNVIDSDVKQLSLLARKRIEENYTEENRKEKLLKLIAELIKK